MPYTSGTPVSAVVSDPAFGDCGRLIFPLNNAYWRGRTLGEISLAWYTDIRPEKTVEVCNYLRDRAASGEKVFCDIYTEEEKSKDPDLCSTGLFVFRGEPGSKFAVCCAGGGFAYVGAIHDSFPVALELSKMGYNAFAIIYRPDAYRACADLSRAISVILSNPDEFGVNVSDYSLWGGSAGARMASWVGTYGTAEFGSPRCPRPAAVIMQYTGLSEATGREPPTYACVGDADGIADYRRVRRYIEEIGHSGTDTEIQVFRGLHHGFGLGIGTAAEGWVKNAVAFWERNSDHSKKRDLSITSANKVSFALQTEDPRRVFSALSLERNYPVMVLSASQSRYCMKDPDCSAKQ